VTFLGAIAVAAVILSLLAILAVARRRGIEVSPIADVRAGAFDRLARARQVQPEGALVLLQGSAAARATPSSVEASRASAREMKADSEGAAAEWGAAVADGVIPAAYVWERWSSVDHHVFQAFSHLAGKQIEGMADLLQVVDTKGYALGSAEFVNKLLGHVGEWHAQEHLASAGLDVSMPDATNVPGLDLWVDGHAVNIKTVKDAAAAAYSHFGDYPDIPIVVPADAENIPADALHFDPSSGFDHVGLAGSDHLVIVDHALSHADVLDQSNHALDVLRNPGLHLHFPWVTAAVSGIREARLLAKGHTDLTRAAKNVAVDTAVVGGGGAVGMKFGALVGSALGPIGAVVGGLAGGLLGAIGGRSAANAVKRAPLEAARTEYDAALARYCETEASLVAEAGATWKRGQHEEGRILRAELSRLQGEYDGVLAGHAVRLRRATILDEEGARDLLSAADSKLEAICAAERAVLLGLLPRWMWIWAGLFFPAQVQRYMQHRREYDDWRACAENVLRGWTGSASDTSACFDLVTATEGGHRVAEQHIARSEVARQQAVETAAAHHRRLLAQAAQCRVAAVARLRDRWEETRAHVETSLMPVVHILRATGAELQREMQKNGARVSK
jgi:hypothetical protein